MFQTISVLSRPGHAFGAVRSTVAFLLIGMLLSGIYAGPLQAQQQEEGAVTGTVLDAETGESLPSATVALHAEADSSLVTGTVTGSDGTFRLEDAPTGTYYLRISFVGYEERLIPDITITEDEVVELGEIALAQDDQQLEEMEVISEREYRETAIDRTIYNTGDQPLTQGGSAIDVLGTIPSLEVDLDDNISLRGSQNVAIYINGRPAPMTGQALTGFLRGLNAGDVERVEVIPNPSASHEPEGTSGIVNIVLSRDVSPGFGGGINASLSTTGDRFGGSGNVRYGYGPLSLHANYGLRTSQRSSSQERYRENRYTNPLTYLEQDSEGESSSLSHYFNTTAEYELGERNTLSFSSMLSRRTGSNENMTSYHHLDGDESLAAHYDRQSIGESADFEMDYQLTFRHIVEPGTHELTIEADYEREFENDESQYLNEILVGGGQNNIPDEEEQHVDEDEDSHEASFEIDYERPLGENGKLEAGYRGTFDQLNSRLYSETLHSETGRFEPDVERNNAFTYDELLHAAYGVVGREWGPVGAQVGVRMEQAYTTFDLRSQGEVYDNSYFSIYPSGHLSYNPTERLTLTASYSKRVSRPNTWQLNPFDNQQDPTFRRVGNPYLEPEYTHAGEIGATQVGDRYSASISTYYRQTVNVIEWNEELNDEGVSVRTFENFSTRDSYGLELNGSLRLGRNFRINASLNGYRRITDGSNIDDDLTNGAFGYSTRLRASWEVRDGLDLQLMQYYRAPMDVPGGRRSSRTRTSIAVRQQLFDDRLSLNLSARDVFDSRSRRSERETDRFYQQTIRHGDPRGVRLSLRYNFGQESGGRGGGRGGRRR